MKAQFLLSILLAHAATGAPFREPSAEDFESPHVVPLEAKWETGRLIIEKKQEEQAAILAREQIGYIVGHLNGFGGVADIAHSRISIQSVTPLSETTLEVKYGATVTVAWPREYQKPTRFTSIFPLRTDAKGKKAFFDAYGAVCVGGDEPAEPASYFYYYRPQARRCRLLQGEFDPEIALAATFVMAPSALETSGKSPEYTKVWEDGVLNATMIFGTYADGATSESDVGVSNFVTAYYSLRRYLGTPISETLPPGQVPGLQNPDLEMSFSYRDGKKVNIAFFLIQKSDLKHPTAAFKKRYHERTLISDLVTYNGHSGMGSNIRALSKLGKFAEGHYQIFFVNGCDTFAYVDESLNHAVAAVNPGHKGTKFLDLITNAMPSPFNGFANNAVQLVASLYHQSDTYRVILSRLNASQRALVTGEEDN